MAKESKKTSKGKKKRRLYTLGLSIFNLHLIILLLPLLI